MDPNLLLNEEPYVRSPFQPFPFQGNMELKKYRLVPVYGSIFSKFLPAFIFLCSFTAKMQMHNVILVIHCCNRSALTIPELCLQNYQVKLTLNTKLPIFQGKMQATGNDIRFTDEQCKDLSYWIESVTNTSATILWLNVNTLLAHGVTTINMYSSNPFAPAVSSGSTTLVPYYRKAKVQQ